MLSFDYNKINLSIVLSMDISLIYIYLLYKNFFYLFNKYLFCMHYMPGIEIGTQDSLEDKTKEKNVFILMRQKDRNYVYKNTFYVIK